MAWSLDDRLRIPYNAGVLAFIAREQPSAHDDVATALIDAAKGLPNARRYCPDPPAYAYVALHTAAWRMFGLAIGMSTVAFRLPSDLEQEATTDGGTPLPDPGPGWFAFQPWDVALPKSATDERVRRWCRAAYEAADASRRRVSQECR